MFRPIKPADTRETKQVSSVRYLELLVKALKKLDDENNEETVQRMCERVEMSVSMFKLHHSRLDHFSDYMEEGETYTKALKFLENEALTTHRNAVIKFFKDHNMDNPSLNYIMREGKKRLGIEWLPKKFACNMSWAKILRFKISPRKDKHLPARLKPFTMWLNKVLAEDGCVSNGDAKDKYTELFGAPKSQTAWSRFSHRMRARYDLKAEKVKSRAGKWEYFWIGGEE